MNAVYSLILVCCLLGSVLAKNSTITYDEKPIAETDPGSTESSELEADEVRCYDCFFFIRGSSREGDERCELLDDAQNIPTETCKGRCAKEWVMENALTSYLYVTRYCLEECEEGVERRYGNDLIRTCCDTDLCNSGSALTSTALAIVMMAVLAVARY